MKFRKKPVVIEAFQFTGNNHSEVYKWAQSLEGEKPLPFSDIGGHTLEVATLEGTMIASKGDFIIRGIKGEYYPCKPDIFDATYEKAVSFEEQRDNRFGR